MMNDFDVFFRIAYYEDMNIYQLLPSVTWIDNLKMEVTIHP